MIHLISTYQGYLLNNHILLYATHPNDDYINLARFQGSVMSYGQTPSLIIDYPGEYDINTVDITCFAESDGVLDYHIVDTGEVIAVIQSAKALEFDKFTSVDYRIVPDQSLAQHIAKMELDGTVMVLDEVSESSQSDVQSDMSV